MFVRSHDNKPNNKEKVPLQLTYTGLYILCDTEIYGHTLECECG